MFLPIFINLYLFFSVSFPYLKIVHAFIKCINIFYISWFLFLFCEKMCYVSWNLWFFFKCVNMFIYHNFLNYAHKCVTFQEENHFFNCHEQFLIMSTFLEDTNIFWILDEHFLKTRWTFLNTYIGTSFEIHMNSL